MNPEWKSFLINAGAEFTETRVESFGNPEQERRIAHTGDIICDLSHYGLISAQGEDTVSFLQGQLSNDISLVDSGHSQLAAYCNPKGRMLANFRIFKHEDKLCLTLPAELLEPIMARLRMFVMRSKVQLDNTGDEILRFGLSGPRAEELLSDIMDKIPCNTDEVTQHNNCAIIRIAGIVPRFEIYGPFGELTELWQALDVNAAPVGADIWELLNIQAGVPVIVAATSEAFVPQMANMELINGVNFKKGCYTGQEIVARMHYLGKLKRRMYRIRVNTDKAPAPGDSLFTENSAAGSGTGAIVSAQQHADGGYEALAVIQISDAENQTLKLHNAEGPEIEVLSLPYSLKQKE